MPIVAGRLTTPLCVTLGIELPIIQAPIGSATTPGLAAAVSNAGGLGHLSGTWLPVARLIDRIRSTSQMTREPFAVNLVLEFDIAERLDAALAEGTRVISTAWGDPTRVHPRIDAAGAFHLHACGSVDEARRAVEAGVDAIVAQGWEAGGHVLGTTASMPLIPAVVDAVSPIPVIAAGGIADGRGLAAALMLGGQAVWMGTRFLAAAESDTHDHYRRRVVGATPESAVYTTAFDGGWPRAPHRALRNNTLRQWEAAARPLAPNRPGEGDVVAVDAAGEPHLRYEDLMPLPGMTGDLDEMALYAGQSAGLVRKIQPADEIVREIAAGALVALDSVSRG